MEHSKQAASTPTIAGPQSPAAATPVTPPVAPVGVLTDKQRVLLAAVLNRIVPAHGDLPSAGDLGVGERIEATLAVAPALRRRFLDGLAAIASAGEQPFTDLDGAAQDAALRAVEAAQPAFFAALVEHAYRHYYTLPAVHHAIGYESRPPQPEGYQLPPFDPALLTAQRRRALLAAGQVTVLQVTGSQVAGCGSTMRFHKAHTTTSLADDTVIHAVGGY